MHADLISPKDRAAMRGIMTGIQRGMAQAVRMNARTVQKVQRERERATRQAERQARRRAITRADLLDRAILGYTQMRTFALSPDVQELIRLWEESNERHHLGASWRPPMFFFYDASQPIVEKQTRDVQIAFTKEYMLLCHGTRSHDEGMDEVVIGYDDPDDQVRDYLSDFIDAGTYNSIAAMNGTDEPWSPAGIVLSVFLDCALKKKFTLIAKRAVKAEIARHKQK